MDTVFIALEGQQVPLIVETGSFGLAQKLLRQIEVSGVAASDAAATALAAAAAAEQAKDDTITGLNAKAAKDGSDITSGADWRSALALGDSAVLDVGTGAGSVAAGDDSRIVGAAQAAENLSDLTDKSAARDALELGDAAVKNTGTGAGTVAAGDDARLIAVASKADRRAIDPKSAPYNATGDGEEDDQSALEAAIAAVETVKVMDVPHGTFLLDGPLALTDTAATIRGTGEGSSTLRWAEPGGLSITNTDTNQNEVVIEGIRLDTSAEDAGAAITIVNPDLDATPSSRTARLADVYVGQVFGSAGYWNVGIDLTECREFIGDGMTLANLDQQGVGISINSDDFSTNYFIDKSWFFSWDKGIEFNQADVGSDGAEGLHIQQGVFISCNTGIHWNCPDKPETLLMVEGSHFDCFYAGIDAEGCLQGLVVGCHFQLQYDSTDTGFGARFSESSEIIISSSVFHKPGTTGEWRPIRLVDTQHALVIGNTFEDYAEGVELDPDSSNIKILANDWHDRLAPPVAINGATNVNVQSFEGRTAMPSAGYWTRGEFVYNVEPSIINGMVLTGWRRLTSGNGHTAGTDWAGEYVAVDPPLRASLAWDPPSTPSGGQNYVDVTVAGAAVGDFAQASSPDGLSNLTLSATVTAANTVRVYLQNLTGSAVDLGSLTIRVKVTK